jgi:hypothetical protein
MMKLQEAIRLRDEYRGKLTGKPFTAKDQAWQIKDVIVSNKKYVSDIYKKMYRDGISNEFAIKFFTIKENDFYVYVLTHQWPPENTDLHFTSIDGYLKFTR